MADQEKGFFEDTKQLVENYVQNRLLLIKLQTAEKSAKLVSLVFTGIILALLSFFILLFLSIMAGYFLAAKTGSLYYGFGLVAAFYILLLVVLLSLRKRFLHKYIMDMVVRIFFDSTAEKDEAEN